MVFTNNISFTTIGDKKVGKKIKNGAYIASFADDIGSCELAARNIIRQYARVGCNHCTVRNPSPRPRVVSVLPLYLY